MNNESEPGDIWHDDEDTYWGGPLPKPGQGWTLAASTYDGVPRWEADWETIGKAVDAMSMFQELPDHLPDWGSLLDGFSRLHVLADAPMGWPPLRDLNDFLQIGDYFLPFTSQNELPARHLLYILEDQRDVTDPLLAEFEELAKRLREYPPLKPCVRRM
jgi:hypothetical protein